MGHLQSKVDFQMDHARSAHMSRGAWGAELTTDELASSAPSFRSTSAWTMYSQQGSRDMYSNV